MPFERDSADLRLAGRHARFCKKPAEGHRQSERSWSTGKARFSKILEGFMIGTVKFNFPHSLRFGFALHGTFFRGSITMPRAGGCDLPRMGRSWRTNPRNQAMASEKPPFRAGLNESEISLKSSSSGRLLPDERSRLAGTFREEDKAPIK